MNDFDKCWCGSNLEYLYCHKSFDEKLKNAEKQGYLIPTKRMIKNEMQIEGIKKAAKVNNGMLDYIGSKIKEGVSTLDIDNWCCEFLEKNNAHSADLNYEGYPKSVCTSVNDVICHGIPSEKVILKDGDIINVDATTEYKGYYADASRMYEIGTISSEAKRLIEVTKKCLAEAINIIVPWKTTIGDIGILIEKLAHQNGYTVVEEYCGHGVGLKMHEDPFVLHYDAGIESNLIVPGMVFTIEPMINQGKRNIRFKKGDSWTSYTVDGKLSAQVEHTILITNDGVEILSK